jgi:ABC-type dipeptide/oligopeptide/nickel transport system permease component
MRLLRRLLTVPLLLITVTLATFALAHAVPGDAATANADVRGATPEALAAFRGQYGLDRPLPAQYLSWLWRSARLDFGVSLGDGRSVRAKLGRALPVTLTLALLATGLAFLVAMPLGIGLGMADRSRFSAIVAAGLHVVYALPGAAVALAVLAAGAPYGGSRGALFAGAACLALPEAARLARYQRGAVLVELAADYVLAARARGAGSARVALHVTRNALLPMITLFGAELPALLSASVIVEQVFGLPGIGFIACDAVLKRDYPLLLGLATTGALVTLACVLLADLGYELCDPRLRGRAA